ncbi:MAG: hypothetical protein AAFY41_07425, partial [Bacteroidota bacterium]
FWPFTLLYFPVFFYYFWLALKSRSFFFFTASNPKIDFGGMLGEKKSDIYNQIPDKFIPKTVLIEKGDLIKASFEAERIGFPVIAKPDIGERGTWVEKIGNQEQLKKYVEACPVDFLVQELVDFPLELGIFYVKHPGQSGGITSIVRKGFLRVIGDGKLTVQELLSQNTRAQLTANLTSDFIKKVGNHILKRGEDLMVEPIGNHCRGTMFLNDNPQIDASLTHAFNQLAAEIPDFYFGRFDIKCNSYEDLKQLQNFRIIELNGAGAEPGHIYQPGYSLFKAYRDIFWHLRVLSDISIANRKNGHAYWGFKKGLKKWRSHNRYNRLLANK